MRDFAGDNPEQDGLLAQELARPLADPIWPVEIADQIKALTRGRWRRYPEYLAVCHHLSRPYRPPRGDAVTHLRQAWRFLTRPFSFEVESLPPCQVLLFHSTYKPSWWPALGDLARRLARRGHRCALASVDRMEIWEPGAERGHLVAGYARWWRQAAGAREGIRSWLRSLLTTGSLLRRAATAQDRRCFRVLRRHLAATWLHLLLSAHRLEVARRLMAALRPRLLVVNQEQGLVGGELLAMADPQATYRVLFLADPPTQMRPILSDEVWVFNSLMAEEVRRACRERARPPRVEIVGSAQLDYLYHRSRPTSAAAEELRRATRGHPTLVYLSEHVGLPWGDYEIPLWRKTTAWLAYAARALPHWRFVYKPRATATREVPPGAEMLEGVDNFLVAPGEVDLTTYLGWDHVLVVAAASSSGLFTAAGVGKRALVLRVLRSRFVWDLVRAVAYAEIGSPREMVHTLRAIEAQWREGRPWSPPGGHFPHRGRTQERLEERALAVLEAEPR